MLLSCILEYDLQCTSSVPTDKTIERTVDVRSIRDIVKALRTNLHKCLMQLSVDNNFVCAAFSCSMHLANSQLLLEDEEQNLVSWSFAKITGVKGKTMLDLSNNDVLACYVWIFFQWLHALGEIVVKWNGGNTDTMESLTSMRKQWRETQCCRFGGMDEESLDLEDSKSLETWDRLLIDFEDLAFPSKIKNNENNVVNIYAKAFTLHQQQQEKLNESSSFEPWAPSIFVKKSVKELMAVILSAS